MADYNTCIKWICEDKKDMLRLKPEDFKHYFSDDDSCLEWLKNQLYPGGIDCPVCKKITKHHKLSKRPCYCCDSCGHQVYPTAGTIFYQSSVPLKTWFEIISRISSSKNRVTIREIQKEYRMTYKTAWRVVKKVKEFIRDNAANSRYYIEPSPISGGPTNLFISGSEMQNLGVAGLNPGTNNSSNLDTGSSSADNKHGSTKSYFRKRDRTARLLKIQMLLCQNPQGLGIKEIAERCFISNRTAYRDIRALEYEMNIPIWQNGNKLGIVEGYFLPPINITLAEATTLFMAVRLIQNYFTEYDPNIASLFTKLNTITPEPLKNDIQRILEYLEKQPRDLRKVRNFNTLISAWLSRHKVKVITQAHHFEEPVERVIDPYMIEPSAIGGGTYVIAFCNLRKKVYAFKIEHILGDVMMLTDTYEIPPDFDVIDYLGSAWGIQTDQELQTIKLRFNPRISRIILEEGRKVHSTQINEVQPDGSLIMSFKFRDYIHIRNWIMGWGDDVEVIEPENLRIQIRDAAQTIANIYSNKGDPLA